MGNRRIDDNILLGPGTRGNPLNAKLLVDFDPGNSDGVALDVEPSAASGNERAGVKLGSFFIGQDPAKTGSANFGIADADGALVAELASAAGVKASTSDVCFGRLTLETGVAVSSADQTAKTSVFFTPFRGSSVSVYDGSSSWLALPVAEPELALGAVAAHANYDIFAYNNAGTLALEKLAWLNATVTVTLASPGVFTWVAHGMSNGDPIAFSTTGALPTGLSAATQYWVVNKADDTFQVSATVGGAAVNTSVSQSGVHTAWQSRQRGTALVARDGVLVKSGDSTRRYLGTIRTTSTTATEDSAAKRFVFNYNHDCRAARRMVAALETTDSWAYSTLAWRQANGAVANQLALVSGAADVRIEATVIGAVINSTSSNRVVAVGVGIDSLTANSAPHFGQWVQNSVFQAPTASYDGLVGVGYHFVAWLEQGAGTDTQTWYGDNSGATQLQRGISGTCWV